MSQCVPNWDIDDPSNPSHGLALQPTPASVPARAKGEYEVAELTWVNGHPSMHGMGQIRMGKPSAKYGPPPQWDKNGGTLESVVDQATGTILLPADLGSPAQHDYDLVPWIAQQGQGGGGGGGCSGTTATATTGGAVVMDALVPCANRGDEGTRVPDPGGARSSKRAREGNCSGSAASMGLQVETYGEDVGFTTSTTPIDESPETENTAAADEHDSASQNRHSKRDGGDGEEKKGGQAVRSSVSTKRSRAAAVHNQSERKRRDRINQRMKTLQKLVPNSSKTDKASMLDEVIDYLKQLQAQVQMMSRMTTMAPPMMMPMPMQQLQMAMMAQMAQMAQMALGLGMAMGVDMNINPLARPQPQTQPPGMVVPNSTPAAMLHPSSFMPLPFAANSLWDATDQRAIAHSGAVPPLPATDPFSAFMACQTQMPMNMDTFNRMAAAMYQQLYQQPSQQNPNPNK